MGGTGGRNLPKGMALAVIKQICGWVEEGKKAPKGGFLAQWEADLAYVQEHDALSEDILARIETGVAAHMAELEAQSETHGHDGAGGVPAISPA